MEIHLKIIGCILSLLALSHMVFPRYFNWKEELPAISLINRQIIQVHTFFIGFLVLLLGVLCLTSSYELVHTPLGRRLATGLAIFWATRLYFQFFVYDMRLWRGKRFETIVHILFSFTWTYFTIVFLMVGFKVF